MPVFKNLKYIKNLMVDASNNEIENLDEFFKDLLQYE